ncbi:MAG: hypothetical protein RR635_08345 [Oscillospiraceae bacterium]
MHDRATNRCRRRCVSPTSSRFTLSPHARRACQGVAQPRVFAAADRAALYKSIFAMVMVGLLVKFLATSAFVSFLVVCASSTAIVLFCPLIVCQLNLQSKTNNQSPRKKAQKIIGAEIGLLLIGFAFGIDREFLMCASLGMGCASISFVSINQKERGDLT